MSVERISSNKVNSFHIEIPRKAQEPVDAPNKTELPTQIPAQGNGVEPSKEKLEHMVKGLNEFVQATNTSLKFELHEELQEYYVTVVDHNQEVVKEIPSKKMLDMYAAMAKFVGILVDKKI
jgi:flagellar protein FlaG